jgi:hypothetical protein
LQHFNDGGCDGKAKTAIRSVRASKVVFTRSSNSGAA